MEILSINADQKIIKLASSVGRNPLSWDGWLCLHIDLHEIEDELYMDALICAKALGESYLKDIEGRIYLCENKAIHILCKNVPNKILAQASQHICETVYNEAKLSLNPIIYDLADEGFVYAQRVLENAGNIFSLPVSIHADLVDIPLTEIEGEIDMHAFGDKKVLLVEDDPVTRWMVRSALKHQCEFICAPTANKAYGIYSSYQPDVVFLDIDLPDGNGYAVLEWIMRNDPGACVVMFSSNDNLDNITNALDDGAAGFIAKPFLKEQLLHYVQS